MSFLIIFWIYFRAHVIPRIFYLLRPQSAFNSEVVSNAYPSCTYLLESPVPPMPWSSPVVVAGLAALLGDKPHAAPAAYWDAAHPGNVTNRSPGRRAPTVNALHACLPLSISHPAPIPCGEECLLAISNPLDVPCPGSCKSMKNLASALPTAAAPASGHFLWWTMHKLLKRLRGWTSWIKPSFCL